MGAAAGAGAEVGAGPSRARARGRDGGRVGEGGSRTNDWRPATRGPHTVVVMPGVRNPQAKHPPKTEVNQTRPDPLMAA